MNIEMSVWDAAFMRMVCAVAPKQHEEYKAARKLRRRIEKEGAEAFEGCELRDNGTFNVSGNVAGMLTLDLSIDELALVDGLAKRIVWDPRQIPLSFIDRAFDFVEDQLAVWVDEAKAAALYEQLPASQKAALRRQAQKKGDDEM